MTNSLGELRGYSLWSPAALSPQKKYPVIITQTVNEWLPCTQTAANLGCYFAMVTRPFWRNQHIENWGADAMAMYEVLAKNPNVDTNRIFLWGRSMETGYLCQLLAEKPNLWKGVILFDPGGLPDLEGLRGKKLFIITGNDADNAKYLKKYQDQAAAAGVSLTLILQENTMHVSDTISSERARTIEFAKFLDENL
jgi:dienelactone hydrolase